MAETAENTVITVQEVPGDDISVTTEDGETFSDSVAELHDAAENEDVAVLTMSSVINRSTSNGHVHFEQNGTGQSIDNVSSPRPGCEDLAVVWTDLSVYKKAAIQLKIGDKLFYERHEKLILRKVNGYVKFGHLTAIMGPSGSGKSTLLKSLFGISPAKCKGNIWVNRTHRKAAFISQNEQDHLLETLTVEESIVYARRIKNQTNGLRGIFRIQKTASGSGDSIDEESMVTENGLEEINNLIRQLGLERCRHTRVKKCSGGERKRLAIAQELAADEQPSILFIDEPTSGLDSDASIKVIKQLQGFSKDDDINVVESIQSLARNGKMAIVVTIHQPSYRLLTFFDHVYVLSLNATCIYSGPSGNALKQHLLTIGLDCSDGHNPADVVIEAASIIVPAASHPKEDYNQLAIWCDSVCRVIKSIICCQYQCLCCKAYVERPAPSHINMNPRHDTFSSCFEEMPEMDALPGMALEKLVALENHADRANLNVITGSDFRGMDRVEYLYPSSVPWSIWHFWHLFWRGVVTGIVRKRSEFLMRILPAILMAFVLGSVYGTGIGRDSGCLDIPIFVPRLLMRDTILAELKEVSDAANATSLIFFSLLFLTFIRYVLILTYIISNYCYFHHAVVNSMIPTVLTFPKEIKLFQCEKFNGWYNCRSYYWAMTFIEFIIIYILVYFFTLIVFSKTGFPGLYGADSRFHKYVFISGLLALVSQGAALTIGTIFSNSFINTILGGVSVILFNVLFSGFFVTALPGSAVSYISTLSFSKYALESSLLVIYGFNRCGPKKSIVNGITHKFNLKDSDYWGNVMALVMYLIFFRVVTAVMLGVRAKCDFNEVFSIHRKRGEKFKSYLFAMLAIGLLTCFVLLYLVH